MEKSVVMHLVSESEQINNTFCSLSQLAWKQFKEEAEFNVLRNESLILISKQEHEMKYET